MKKNRIKPHSNKKLEKISELEQNPPFRIVIAVRKPRFRIRVEHASAMEGWEVTSLVTQQDPVGLCAKLPRPPDVLVLSYDFGHQQKRLGIFRAVQRFRSEGLQIIGLFESCEGPYEGDENPLPGSLCDICLSPPYLTEELRAILSSIYEKVRGEPAPQPEQKVVVEEE